MNESKNLKQVNMKKLLFFTVALITATISHAQLYDSPEKVYYFVEGDENDIILGSPSKVNYYTEVLIFNFDGEEACLLNYSADEGVECLGEVTKNMRIAPNYYDVLVYLNDYDVKYIGSDFMEEIYQLSWNKTTYETIEGYDIALNHFYTDKYYVTDFGSGDRIIKRISDHVYLGPSLPFLPDPGKHYESRTFFIQVPKSFFVENYRKLEP